MRIFTVVGNLEMAGDLKNCVFQVWKCHAILIITISIVITCLSGYTLLIIFDD